VLFVALAIMGTMRMEYDRQTDVVPPFQCGEFDQEIDILYGRMAAKVINVLCHFLHFVESFSYERAHNMVVLCWIHTSKAWITSWITLARIKLPYDCKNMMS
jgi:hypothetical protein